MRSSILISPTSCRRARWRRGPEDEREPEGARERNGPATTGEHHLPDHGPERYINEDGRREVHLATELALGNHELRAIDQVVTLDHYREGAAELAEARD